MSTVFGIVTKPFIAAAQWSQKHSDKIKAVAMAVAGVALAALGAYLVIQHRGGLLPMFLVSHFYGTNIGGFFKDMGLTLVGTGLLFGGIFLVSEAWDIFRRNS